MLNIFKNTLKKLNEMDYIVVLEGNNYMVKEKNSGKIFAKTSYNTKKKESWLEKCYDELKMVG